MANGLTHFDKEGNAVMVDVSGKNVTYRTALATGNKFAPEWMDFCSHFLQKILPTPWKLCCETQPLVGVWLSRLPTKICATRKICSVC